MRTEDQLRRELEIQRTVRRKNEARVLTHLTDASHAISPCPDNGSVWPVHTELASQFRSQNGRWPVWWEMAKLIQDNGKD